MWSSCYLYLFPYKIIHHSCYRTIPQLNEKIFEILRIKHSVSSACQQQTNRQVMDCRRQYMHVVWLLKQTNIIKYICDLFWNMKDGRTNMRHVRKYVNENDNNWDLHLPAVVYGINTALQVGVSLSWSSNNVFFFLSLSDCYVMLNIFGSRLLPGILPFSWCFIGILVYPWLWMPVPWEMLLRSEIRRRTSAPLWQNWRRWMIRSAPFHVPPTSDCLVWKNFKLNL